MVAMPDATGTLWDYATQVRENTRLPRDRKHSLRPNPDISFAGRPRRPGDEEHYATPWTETVELDPMIPEEEPYQPRTWSINAVGLTPAAAHAALLAAVEELRQRLREESASWTL
jgi:hypothetical protein